MSEFTDLIAASAGGDADATAKLEAMNTSATGAEEVSARLVAMTKKADDAVSRRQAAGKLSAADVEELDTLRQQSKDAEDAKAIAAGDFTKATERHKTELQAAKDLTAAAGRDRDDELIKGLFMGAAELFGPTGTTILTPDIARSHYGSHVTFDPGENGSPRRAVVRDRKGEIILAEGGEPATVAAGLAQLIESDPQARSILRAGGKVGSGAHTAPDEFNAGTATRAELVAAGQRGDQKAIAELRRTSKAASVRGTHWEDEAAKAAAAAG